MYQRVEHPMKEYLNYFVTAHNTRTLAVLGELSLVIPRCRTDQFSRSSLPPACLCNLLLLGRFTGDTLSSLKSAMILCLQRASLDLFFIFCSVSFCCSIACSVYSGAVLVYRGIPFPNSMCQVILTIMITFLKF